MKSKKSLSILAFFSFIAVGHSQSALCPYFSISSVFQDSINPSTYQISIEYTAADSNFASYTFVSSILDCNNDTVATGQSFWFGQLGQTTLDYPVTLTGNGDISCFPLSVSFVYMNEIGEFDTCLYSYSFGGIDQFNDSREVNIFPNPTNDILTITVPFNQGLKDYVLVDQNGTIILHGTFQPNETQIDLGNFSKSIYFILLGGKAQWRYRVIKT